MKENKNMKISNASMLMLALAGLSADFQTRSQYKQACKCLLPDCKEQTVHNEGYCSAKHHKLHKEKKINL